MLTLLEIKKIQYFVDFRTISFDPTTKQFQKSPQSFSVDQDEFAALRSAGDHFLARNIDSFAEFHITMDGAMEIGFTWLQPSCEESSDCSSRKELSGYSEWFQLNHEVFKAFLAQHSLDEDEEDTLTILVENDD